MLYWLSALDAITGYWGIVTNKKNMGIFKLLFFAVKLWIMLLYKIKYSLRVLPGFSIKANGMVDFW